MDIAQSIWNMLDIPSPSTCSCDPMDMAPTDSADGNRLCNTCSGQISETKLNSYNQYFGYSGYDDYGDEA